jgi:hypothetical protein
MKPRIEKALIIILMMATSACGKATPQTPAPATQAPLIPSASATLEPTIQPSATYTPEPAGPCVNIFYPFVPSQQWIYQVDDGDDTTNDLIKVGLTVSSVDGNQAKVDALDLSTGVITHTTAECNNGAILNYPLLTLGTLFGNMVSGQLDVTYIGGVFMPAESDLVAANWNSSWTGDYKAKGTFTATEEGETSTLILDDSPVHLEWSLVGKEPITVKAGTYAEAYKVTRKATVDGSLQMEGSSVKARLIISTDQWYSARVGLLKSVIASSSIVYGGTTFPADLKSRIEMIEFRKAQ